MLVAVAAGGMNAFIACQNALDGRLVLGAVFLGAAVLFICLAALGRFPSLAENALDSDRVLRWASAFRGWVERHPALEARFQAWHAKDRRIWWEDDPHDGGNFVRGKNKIGDRFCIAWVRTPREEQAYHYELDINPHCPDGRLFCRQHRIEGVARGTIPECKAAAVAWVHQQYPVAEPVKGTYDQPGNDESPASRS